MQIKYLKDAPLGKKDDVAEVADDQANVLITLGYAKEYKSRAKSDSQNNLLTDNTTDSE